jgi:hypothetical protein
MIKNPHALAVAFALALVLTAFVVVALVGSDRTAPIAPQPATGPAAATTGPVPMPPVTVSVVVPTPVGQVRP